jgi:hypothetical protein
MNLCLLLLALALPEAPPPSPPVVIDYAKAGHWQDWLHHPIYGDPSWDTFERLPNNPVIIGEPPLEWPVNGFLFEDPQSGHWYLYAGRYAAGYAAGVGKNMACTVSRSTDQGASWEHLGPIFTDEPFRFEGDTVTVGRAPDVSVVYHEGKYHLAYDWVTDAMTWEAAHNPTRDTDGGVGYAWSEKPEGPFTRHPVALKRTSEQPLLLGKYKRVYASTLIRRANDWLVLTLTDSGPYFGWAWLGMTAASPEGPYSDLKPLVSVESNNYHPPLLEFFPAFTHEGMIYSPATSVAKNRNYQALYRVPIEEAMDPEAWETAQFGSIWHAEPVPHEYHGIWGQAFSGFVDDKGLFNVLFPSRTADNLGTLNLARRPWDSPMVDQGFVLSGHGAHSLGLLQRHYTAFTLQVKLDMQGKVRLLWDYTAPLGPDQPRSDAGLHPLSLTRYNAVELEGDEWRVLIVNDAGDERVIAAGKRDVDQGKDLALLRDGTGQVQFLVTGERLWFGRLPSGSGALGLLCMPQSHARVERFTVTGEPGAATIPLLAGEAILGAAQNMADWEMVEDKSFRYGSGLVSKQEVARAKWNFYGTGFRLFTPKGSEYGRVAVIVDGVEQGVVDFAAEAQQKSEALFEQSGLAPGYHAVVLEAREGKLPLDTLDITVAPPNTK